MRALILPLLLAVLPLRGAEIVFQDEFKEKLGEGWTWRREDRSAWRVGDHGLEIRVQPGNMWGPANDAKNVLLRPAPAVTGSGLDIRATVENAPAHQYEQVDLVWYYDDSHMVKIGLEQVDGQLSIVMGREERDRTRTLAIIPNSIHKVELRLAVKEDRITGYFRPTGTDDWRKAGECDLPGKGAARISLQVYQGPEGAQRWARIHHFQISR